MTVIPQLSGHGIGKDFHCPPDIYHTLNNYPGVMMPGMPSLF
jgi:methionyl aminopeptidase